MDDVTAATWQSQVLRELNPDATGLVMLTVPRPASTPKRPPVPRPSQRPESAPVPGPSQRPARTPESAPDPEPSQRPDGAVRHAAMPPGPPAYAAIPQAPPGRALHGDPLARRVGRAVRRAVGASMSREVHDRMVVATGLQRPVTTTRRIAVTSLRGGAGKTTIAVLVASALAQHRRDRILVVDADPGLGSMAARLGITPGASLRDLAGRQPASFEEAGAYLTQTDARLWILSGADGKAADRPLDMATYQAALSALGRFFAVVVIDCGAGLGDELQRGVLSSVHGCVHVSPATADGALSAGSALDWLGRNGYGEIVSRTVAVFAAHAPHARADLRSATERLRDSGTGVAHLAYDRHLATGGVLTPALLAESTRLGAMQIAADALTRARAER